MLVCLCNVCMASVCQSCRLLAFSDGDKLVYVNIRATIEETSSCPGISAFIFTSPALGGGFLLICAEPLQVQHGRSPTPFPEGLRQKHGSEAFGKTS